MWGRRQFSSQARLLLCVRTCACWVNKAVAGDVFGVVQECEPTYPKKMEEFFNCAHTKRCHFVCLLCKHVENHLENKELGKHSLDYLCPLLVKNKENSVFVCRLITLDSCVRARVCVWEGEERKGSEGWWSLMDGRHPKMTKVGKDQVFPKVWAKFPTFGRRKPNLIHKSD